MDPFTVSIVLGALALMVATGFGVYWLVGKAKKKKELAFDVPEAKEIVVTDQHAKQVSASLDEALVDLAGLKDRTEEAVVAYIEMITDSIAGYLSSVNALSAKMELFSEVLEALTAKDGIDARKIASLKGKLRGVGDDIAASLLSDPRQWTVDYLNSIVLMFEAELGQMSLFAYRHNSEAGALLEKVTRYRAALLGLTINKQLMFEGAELTKIQNKVAVWNGSLQQVSVKLKTPTFSGSTLGREIAAPVIRARITG